MGPCCSQLTELTNAAKDAFKKKTNKQADPEASGWGWFSSKKK